MVAHDYRAFEAGTAQPCGTRSATTLQRETVMTSEDHDADLNRTRSPIGAAAVLLGIYIAMYLTVWLTIRALTSPEAAAAIPPASSAVFAAPVTAIHANAARMSVSTTSTYSTDLDDGNTATDLTDSNGARGPGRLIAVHP